MQRYFLVLTLFTVLASEALGQQLNLQVDSANRASLPLLRTSYCTAPVLGPYTPQCLTSLSKLPDKVSARLKAYLISRVGNRFYNDMRFKSGNYVDLEELHSIEKGSSNRKWAVATYYLCFSCPQLPMSQDNYVASIELDAEGNVILPIALPYIAQDTAKAHVIISQEAHKIAQRHGLKKAEGLISYSPQLDVLVWYFHESKVIRDGLTHEKSLMLHAGSGQVLKKRNYRHRYIPF